MATSLRSLDSMGVLRLLATKVKWCWRVFCLGMGLWCIKEGPEEMRGRRAELCGGEISLLELQFSAVRAQLQCESLHPRENAGYGDG